MECVWWWWGVGGRSRGGGLLVHVLQLDLRTLSVPEVQPLPERVYIQPKGLGTMSPGRAPPQNTFLRGCAWLGGGGTPDPGPFELEQILSLREVQYHLRRYVWD